MSRRGRAGLRAGLRRGSVAAIPPRAVGVEATSSSEPERFSLLARAEIEEEMAAAQKSLDALFAEGQPPPRASEVAVLRNKMSTLERKLKDFDAQRAQEGKVSQLRQLQREQQALQKAVISNASVRESEKNKKVAAARKQQKPEPLHP